MKVGVAGVDRANAMLAHEGNGFNIVNNVPREIWHFRDQRRQDVDMPVGRSEHADGWRRQQ